MTCPKCNHENDADARFCENCGTQLLPAKTKHFIKAVQALALPIVWMIPYATAEAQTTETSAATGSEGGYGGIIILFIVCMIVACIVVTKTLTKKKKNKTTSPMTCPMCNYVNDADARFCENCGAQLKRK